jgi:hypothetical protein
LVIDGTWFLIDKSHPFDCIQLHGEAISPPGNMPKNRVRLFQQGRSMPAINSIFPERLYPRWRRFCWPAASVTAVPRSLASSISPTLASALFSTAFSGLPLVNCGGLKIVYDTSLLLSFRHMKPPEERGARAETVRTSARQCADGVDR